MNDELLKFCEEVTALLNYQSDIPMQHKIDLPEAFEALKKAAEGQQAALAKLAAWTKEEFPPRKNP